METGSHTGSFLWDCQKIDNIIINLLTEKPFSFQMGRGFVHNDCAGGRVFDPFKSCHESLFQRGDDFG